MRSKKIIQKDILADVILDFIVTYDNLFLLLICNDCVIKYSLETNQVVPNWKIKAEDQICTLKCTHNNKYLLMTTNSINDCANLVIYDLKNDLLIKDIKIADRFLMPPLIMRDDRYVFLFDQRNLKVFDMNTLEITQEFENIETNRMSYEIWYYVISEDGKNFIFSNDLCLKVFNLEKKEVIKQITFDNDITEIWPIDDNKNTLVKLYDKTVIVIDNKTFEIVSKSSVIKDKFRELEEIWLIVGLI